MIIACPSCATHHNLPDNNFAIDGSIIKCASCGHSWIEARAIEAIESVKVIDITENDGYFDHSRSSGLSKGRSNLPAIPEAIDTDYEAARIAKAVKQAEQKRHEQRLKSRAKTRGWLSLVASICTPLALAAAFPETVVKALPGTIVVYQKAGIDVNIPGFQFANITHQYLMASGTRILAIRGEIINISGKEQIVPAVRFALRDKQGKEVYFWTLNNIAGRPLRAGSSTSFLTRVASPPKLADDFQIRFARANEFAKTASYENNSNKRPQN